MELWIPITIAAAFTQNLRFALQKHLKGQLSTLGVTFARFIYATPLAIALVLALSAARGVDLPARSPDFWAYAALGGVAQIFATALLVALFSFRNLAVGVAFSKTETVQTVIFSALILHEAISFGGWIGILISLVGVILLSVAPGRFGLAGFWNRATLLGLGSGAFFGISAVSYRAASLALGDGDFIMRAALTLAVVTTMQTVAMALWLRMREPGEIGRVLAQWRVAGLVGLTGMLGSLGWFSAMTLQHAAYVRALGQIELVFTIAASWLFFGERSTGREILGIVLLCIGILFVLLYR